MHTFFSFQIFLLRKNSPSRQLIWCMSKQFLTMPGLQILSASKGFWEQRKEKKMTTIKSIINISTMVVSSTWGMQIQDNGEDKHSPGTQATT